MYAISSDTQLNRLFCCQKLFLDRHYPWLEGILHFVCRAVISTLKLISPIGYRFLRDMASPLLLQLAYYTN